MTETTPINSVGVETYEQAVLRMGRVGGFAPGGYMSRCLKCDRMFDGDKRAISCLPCAVTALSAAPTPPVGQENSSSQGLGEGLSVDASCAPTFDEIQRTAKALHAAAHPGSTWGGRNVNRGYWRRQAIMKLEADGDHKSPSTAESVVSSEPISSPHPARIEAEELAYFGASEFAAYEYPGEDQQALRDAFCRGAAILSRLPIPAGGGEGIHTVDTPAMPGAVKMLVGQEWLDRHVADDPDVDAEACTALQSDLDAARERVRELEAAINQAAGLGYCQGTVESRESQMRLCTRACDFCVSLAKEHPHFDALSNPVTEGER